MESATAFLPDAQPDPEHKLNEEQLMKSLTPATVVATSNSTANTQTTSATTTKTTAMAIATRGSPGAQQEEEAPSTSAAAAAAAAATELPQKSLQPPQEEEQQQQQPQPQQQIQLEPAISADEIVYKEYEAEHQMHVSSLRSIVLKGFQLDFLSLFVRTLCVWYRLSCPSHIQYIRTAILSTTGQNYAS